MRSKILIVGSSSKVAQAISETLTNNDLELIGTYNREYSQNVECYTDLIKIDLMKKEDLKKLKNLDKVSDIIFTIGIVDFLDETKSKINYEILKNLLEYLSKINKNIRIIFCSSSAVYGNNISSSITEKSLKEPTNYYGKYKLMAENALIKSKIDYVIVRFPIVFGSYFKERFNRFIEAIKEDKAVIFGSGKNRFSFIYQTDLSEFFLKIVKNKKIKNNDFNIASGYVTQEEYLKSVSNIYDKKINKSLPLNKLYEIAEKQLESYKKNSKKPSLLKEDIASLSRDRVYNISKAIKIVNWKPKYDINRAVKNTFSESRLLSRWDGIKILKFLYPNRLLPVRIYRNPIDFNPNHFSMKKGDIWSITIRDEEGDIINTDHLFSSNYENIIKFMKRNGKPNKVYIVRLTPPKDMIKYYGSFLVDKNNFENKVMITISKKPEEPFRQRKEGKSFKILPRDFVPGYNLTYENNQITGKFEPKYKKVLEKDIKKLMDFLTKTKREDLTIPILFIISNKGVQYISLGL